MVLASLDLRRPWGLLVFQSPTGSVGKAALVGYNGVGYGMEPLAGCQEGGCGLESPRGRRRGLAGNRRHVPKRLCVGREKAALFGPLFKLARG